MTDASDAACVVDTIVAVASPRSPAVRGVIRLSGPRAFEMALGPHFEPEWDHGAQPSEGPIEREVRPGVWRLKTSDGGGAPVSLWMVTMPSPRSFTGEDVVELHCVGAPVVLGLIQADLVERGARVASPGEFTRRAFVHGKLDLSRAEAVLRLIHAEDDLERAAAVAVLEGGLASSVAEIREAILKVLIPLELGLDFSDQDVEIPVPPEAPDRLARACSDLHQLSAQAVSVGVQRAAWRVVLFGSANAGKSSLFNRLCAEDLAIVNDAPGTTRDPVVAERSLSGHRFCFVDTAGEDVTSGPVDELAHRQRRRWLEDADVKVLVCDGRTADLAAPSPSADLIVFTRRDLVPPSQRSSRGAWIDNRSGQGLEELTGMLVSAVQSRAGGALAAAGREGSSLVNARQGEALSQAAVAVGRARQRLQDGDLVELAASDLHGALAALAEVSGEGLSDLLLDRIFAGFCIGK